MDCCCHRHDCVVFVRVQEDFGNMGLKKLLHVHSLNVCCVGACSISVLMEMQMLEAWPVKCQKEAKDVSVPFV